AGKAAKAANGKAETKADANKAEATSAGAKKAEPNKAATTPDSHKQSATPSWKKLSFRPAKEPRKSPRARGWMFILGLIFLAGGAVGIRELLLE
ncbi:hypothetical protein, partial [Klebsiella pneumoniae]